MVVLESQPQFQAKGGRKSRVAALVLSDRVWAECSLSEGKLRLEWKGRKGKRHPQSSSKAREQHCPTRHTMYFKDII